jgi:hypothetical protein
LVRQNLYYLDLEGTVIDIWNNPKPVNLHLTSILENKNWEIFSFALCNSDDKIFYKENIKFTVEDTFNCRTSSNILVDEVTVDIAKNYGYSLRDVVDIIDYRNTLGKREFFLRYLKYKNIEDSDITFIDDTVENEYHIQKDKGNCIKFIKA